MGLFSALFGGGKSAKSAKPAKGGPAKAAPAMTPPAKTAAKAATSATVTVLTPRSTPQPVPGLTQQRLAYAAYVRAGDAAMAYAIACKLALMFKASGAVALRKVYREAAERQFAILLQAASVEKRPAVLAALVQRLGRVPAATVTRAAAVVGGPEAARLVAGHAAWQAQASGRR